MNGYLMVFSGILLCFLSSAYSMNARYSLRNKDTDPSPSASMDNIFWFIQITDLHLSVHQDTSRSTDFERFCNYTVRTIRPEFVSVSGDITDARSAVFISSKQYLSEWSSYRAAIRKSGILELTKVYDIRGNHDMFDVLRVNHSTDYFSKYGVQGPSHTRSYLYTVRKPFGNYSFINLDACPKAGVNFPLNFFGELTPDVEKQLLEFVSRTERSNHTFWFGHYPTSTIISPRLNLRDLLGQSTFAYFCGHLHTAHRLIPRMYVLQPQGYLELELGDWRDGRYFRIVAVDHDLVSFADFRMFHGTQQTTEWPIVLVTNPKDSDFLLPHKEPMYRILDSTHIRILVWSLYSVLDVSVFIDGEFQGNATRATPSGNDLSPLYVLPWNATRWADRNIHEIRVVATDARNNRRVVSHQFVVNRGPTWNFTRLAGFALHPDHSFNLKLVFYLLEGIFFCFLLMPRLIPSKFSRNCFRSSRFCVGLYRLTHFNPCYIPLMGFILYQCCGPTFMGFLIGYHFGVVFSFGIVVGTTFVVESLTYVYEGIQLLIFVILYVPLPVWYLGKIRAISRMESVNLITTEDNTPSVCDRNPATASTVRVQQSVPIRCVGRIPLALFIHAVIFSSLQLLFLIVTIGIPYGALAAFLSPGRLYPVALCWFIALQANEILAHVPGT
ncbi:Transmembrane protein 62 [Clonorchis sinensis]|uniref:Transmembrane protein 62 n=2 Tax=Clonorchis sinensis TaxID=79923 RepID=A0A8T1MM23_CLOSI|nr:Transmembrane protein 62 [Clonorchis sinensis]